MAQRRTLREAMEIAKHPMNERKVFLYNIGDKLGAIMRLGDEVRFVDKLGRKVGKVTAGDIFENDLLNK